MKIYILRDENDPASYEPHVYTNRSKARSDQKYQLKYPTEGQPVTFEEIDLQEYVTETEKRIHELENLVGKIATWYVNYVSIDGPVFHPPFREDEKKLLSECIDEITLAEIESRKGEY